MRCALVIVALLGCKSDDKPPAPVAGSSAPLAEWLGHAIKPPGQLAKLHVGMTRAEANAAVPGIAELTGSETGLDHVKLAVDLDPEHGTVLTMNIRFPSRDAGDVERAWGKGIAAPDAYGHPATHWFDPATGWRASLDANGDAAQLQLSTYIPAAKFLGDGPEIAALPTPLIGATFAQLVAAYRTQLVLAAGEHAIEFPPTEWGLVPTMVTWVLPEHGPISRVMIGLPYRGIADAKATLRALFVKKWGAATGNGHALVFVTAKQRITATDDSVNGAWEIAIEPSAGTARP